jgi:hypothetical protein
MANYPRQTVMLEDMRGSERFTIEVLNLDAGFRSGSGYFAAKRSALPCDRSSFTGYERSTSLTFIQRVRAFDELNLHSAGLNLRAAIKLVEPGDLNPVSVVRSLAAPPVTPTRRAPDAANYRLSGVRLTSVSPTPKVGSWRKRWSGFEPSTPTLAAACAFPPCPAASVLEGKSDRKAP